MRRATLSAVSRRTVYRATSRAWSADLPVCPGQGNAMIFDRVVSTDVFDHGEVVRLVESAHSVRCAGSLKAVDVHLGPFSGYVCFHFAPRSASRLAHEPVR